jgi:diketogulonate reductase-like aldo/keto reductase
MTLPDASGNAATRLPRTVTIRGDVAMPTLGLGVFLTGAGERTRTAVSGALEAGYRMIDTAAIYGNEGDVGHAVRTAGVDDVFITTKLWNSDHGYQATLDAYERSRRRLGVDVVDLFLIHWPVPGSRLESWRAMEHLLAEGRVRAIGVSNYMSNHLEELLDKADEPPAVNQIELNPYCFGAARRDVLQLCVERGIAVQAYSPLAKGRMLADPALVRVAQRHGRTPAQVLVRWALQQRTVPLPKSTDPRRIAANADVFGFALDDEDMATLDGLDRNLVTPGWDPVGAP